MNATLVREASLTMRFALEPYSEKLVQEMRPLWDMHHEEVPQLGMKIDPDLTAYSTMQKVGALRIYTARVGPMLVGYQIFYVLRHPHRKYSLEANQDILFLETDVRMGMAGTKFIVWCDKELIKEGVKVIFHQISAKNDLGNIFRRMGYELLDLTYARRIP